MAGREVREYTNLSDPKDKKWGKGKDRVDDEDITFQRMVAKMQEVAGERGGYLHGRGALDSDDLLYLKEQMEAEEDAERLLRRTEKRAFAAFKKAASLADSTPPSLPLPLRVEPKPKSGIRQQDLLKKIVEVKPKKPKISEQAQAGQSSPVLPQPSSAAATAEHITAELPSSSKVTGGLSKSLQASSPASSEKCATKDSVSPRPVGVAVDSNKDSVSPRPVGVAVDSNTENPVKSLLGIAYDSSDED